MKEQFQGVYEFGILRLDKPLSLPEHTRVTGILRNIEEVPLPSQDLPPLSLNEFDRLLDELSLDVPPLPVDFSRSDVYLDHD